MGRCVRCRVSRESSLPGVSCMIILLTRARSFTLAQVSLLLRQVNMDLHVQPINSPLGNSPAIRRSANVFQH